MKRPFARSRDASQPEGGLPDPGIALQHQRPEPVDRALEKRCTADSSSSRPIISPIMAWP
jgi:hypothetical protein